MQGIHNDLTRRMASAMKQYITLVSEKVNFVGDLIGFLKWSGLICVDVMYVVHE